MKAFKGSIKPFEVPQRSAKKKIKLIFSLRRGSGRRRVNKVIEENETKYSRMGQVKFVEGSLLFRLFLNTLFQMLINLHKSFKSHHKWLQVV